MTTFVLALAGVALLPMVMLLRPLLSRGTTVQTDRARLNVEIARERLDAMDSPHLDSNSGAQSETEIKAVLLDDLDAAPTTETRRLSPGWALPVVLLIPLLSYLIYDQLGNPELADSRSTHTATDADIGMMVKLLEEKLKSNPDDVRGWELAGRTYMSLKDYDNARIAYDRLNQLVPGNPDNLAALADATIMASQNRYTDESRELVELALSIDPDHINALWLAGLGSLSLGEYEAAIAHLENLKVQAANDAATVEQVDMLIARGRQLQDNVQDPQDSRAGPTGGRTVSLVVDVDESLRGDLPLNGVLYVYAKAQAGPPAPLAVSRTSIGEFPVDVVLDESMAIMPEMTLAAYDDILVGARISASGNATPEPGDLESKDSPLDQNDGNGPVRLVIDSVVE